MPFLSLAMIVKNEEKTLARILTAASQFCDEMIVVDTGSTDDTVRIAESCGATVFHFPWVDDFAAARNFSFSKATGDWILWLDADDVLTPEVIQIGQFIKTQLLPTTTVNVVRALYNYSYNADGTTQLVHGRERFIRRDAGLVWTGKVHEVIDGIGDSWVFCPEFIVEHRTAEENMPRKVGRNLRIYEKSIDLETAGTHDLYLYAGELRGAERYAEALASLKQHMKRWPETDYDLFEEPYMVRIDAVECMRKIGDPIGALRMAGNAIAYNGARAEGYALAAMTQFDQGNYAAAYPLFMAAACCVPPTHGGAAYLAFYSPYIRDMIKECKAQLGHPVPLDNPVKPDTLT